MNRKQSGIGKVKNTSIALSVTSEGSILHRIRTRGGFFAAFSAALLIGIDAQPSVVVAADAAGSGLPGAGAVHAEESETVNRVHVADVRRDDKNDRLVVTLRIDPGYHINANPASYIYLIPTSLNLAGIQPVRVDYPPPVYFKPKFADERIAVYEGTVAIVAIFNKGTLRRASLFGTTITAQACTEIVCFPPADLPVRIPQAAAH